MIIMEELSSNYCHNELSTVFEQKYKNSKSFTIIMENQQLLIILASFLSISDLLAIGVSSKYLRKIIECNINIQNRILKAQVLYLTQEQEQKLKYPKLQKINNNSAYAMISSYWQNYPMPIHDKIQKIQSKQNYQQKFIQPQFLKFIANQAFQLKKKIQNKIKVWKIFDKKKQQIKQNTTVSTTVTQYPKFNQKSIQQIYRLSVQNDKELKLYERWVAMSHQREQQIRMNKIKVQQQKRQYLINRFIEQNVPYTQIAIPDQSLIIHKQTFWEKLKNNFKR